MPEKRGVSEWSKKSVKIVVAVDARHTSEQFSYDAAALIRLTLDVRQLEKYGGHVV
jgi:phosphomannomutase